MGYGPNGKRRRKTIYGRTQGEVKKKLEEQKRRQATRIQSLASLTVEEYMEQWLNDKARNVKPRTEELYRDWNERFVKPYLGREKLENLTPIMVRNLISSIADTTGVPTANKVRRLLFGAVGQAVKWQLLYRNVVEAVDPLKEEPKEVILWTADEAVRFLDVARSSRYYALFYLAMATGLRRGELLGLKWDDLKGDRLYIQRSYTRHAKGLAWTTPKTARGKRYVTLPEDALAVLKQHNKLQTSERRMLGEGRLEAELIFAAETGGPLSPQTLHTVWGRLQTEADVPRVRLHDLRHLHVSLLIKQGFDPRTVADRVGHTDPAFTLRRYSHMFEEQRREAAVNLKVLLGSNTPPNRIN